MSLHVQTVRVGKEQKETLSLSTGINPKNFQNQNDETMLLRIDNIECKQLICPGFETRVTGYRNKRMEKQTCCLLCRYWK
jgi:hypothetical protein